MSLLTTLPENTLNESNLISIKPNQLPTIKKSKTTAKKYRSKIDEYYERYEYLAAQYSNKVYNFERYGFEKQDIEQELKIKIYTSIISWATKWQEYLDTDRYKPVPIQFYLKAAMVNKIKDFIKKFNEDLVENQDKVSLQANTFDYSTYDTIVSTIDFARLKCEINGVDLLEGLCKLGKVCFIMYLKGFKIKELNTKFKSHFDVSKLISNQVQILQQQKNKLLDYNKIRIEVAIFTEE